MCKIIGILLVLVAGKVHGICIHDDRTLAKADIIISVIPMKGELLLETIPSPESEFRSYRIRSMRCAGWNWILVGQTKGRGRQDRYK